MRKHADTLFENMLIDKLTDGKTSAEFIEANIKIFNVPEEELQQYLEEYLGEFTDHSNDVWFYEVCWICGKEKLVHNDMSSSYDNPTFICERCEGLNSDE